MISPEEIETFALQFADAMREVCEHDAADVVGLIGSIAHLSSEDRDAVMTRAREIVLEWIVDDESLQGLVRLARATGCPEGKLAIPWLQARGLIEKIDGRFRFHAAKPGPVGRV